MRICLVLGLFIALTLPSGAVPLKKKTIGGHTIEIRTGRDGQEQLRLNGKVRLTERFISLDAPVVVDGVTVVTGTASNGGNICAGDLFVLTLPQGSPPRLDQPPDACAEFTKKVDGPTLLIDMPATAAGDGQRWVWSRAALSGPQPLTFEPKAEGGWAALTAKTMDHPSELLNFADTAQPLHDRFGAVWADVVSLAFGPGSIKYRDGWAIASSCRAHACDVTALLLAANGETRTVYVAMANGSGVVTLSSPADQWPATARADVAAFEKRWRSAATPTSPPQAPAVPSTPPVQPAAAAPSDSQAPAGSWTYGVHPVLGLSAHLAIGDQAIGIACIPQDHPLSGHVASRRMTPGFWPTATETGGLVAIVNKPFDILGSATYVANKAGSTLR